jgi:hypothetical protein
MIDIRAATAHLMIKSIAPVEAIGTYERHLLLRDSAGFVVAIDLLKLRRAAIAGLFAAAPASLCKYWPASGRRGWSHVRASETIHHLCAKRGEVDPRSHGFEVKYQWPRSGGCKVIVRRPTGWHRPA